MKDTEVVVSDSGKFSCFADDLITRHLKKFGAHQRNELALLLSMIRVGNVVVDVGANIGVFSIPIANKVGKTGRVFSFEPDLDVFELLEKNIMANGLSDIVLPFKNLISSERGFFEVTRVSGNAGATSFNKSNFDASPHVHQIEAISLDDWFTSSQNPVENIDVLKVDAEGMDADVILSAREMITQCRPIIYAEMSTKQLSDRKIGVEEVENLLRDLGYRYFRNIAQRNSCTDVFVVQELDQIAAGGDFFDLLAVPSTANFFPESNAPIGLKFIKKIRWRMGLN